MMREGFLLRFIVTTAFTATYILARSRLTCKAVHDVLLSFIETFPSLFFLLYSSLLHPSVIAPMHRVHRLVNAMIALQQRHAAPDFGARQLLFLTLTKAMTDRLEPLQSMWQRARRAVAHPHPAQRSG